MATVLKQIQKTVNKQTSAQRKEYATLARDQRAMAQVRKEVHKEVYPAGRKGPK